MNQSNENLTHHGRGGFKFWHLRFWLFRLCCYPWFLFSLSFPACCAPHDSQTYSFGHPGHFFAVKRKPAHVTRKDKARGDTEKNSHTLWVELFNLKIFCHSPRRKVLKIVTTVDHIFKLRQPTMAFSRASKRPRSSSITQRSARSARRSLAVSARRPLHEPNARKKVRKDPIPGKTTRKPGIPQTRKKPTRPARGTGTAKSRVARKPMPSTMSAMRTESKSNFIASSRPYRFTSKFGLTIINP